MMQGCRLHTALLMLVLSCYCCPSEAAYCPVINDKDLWGYNTMYTEYCTCQDPDATRRVVSYSAADRQCGVEHYLNGRLISTSYQACKDYYCLCGRGDNCIQCASNGDCSECTNGYFKKSGGCSNDGASCGSSNACTSGTCKAGRCANPSCVSSLCSSCDDKGSCAKCTSTFLTVEAGSCNPKSDGSPCSNNNHCRSKYCEAGKCRATSDGSDCSRDAGCTSGKCKAGKCAGPSCKSERCDFCDSSGKCADCGFFTRSSSGYCETSKVDDSPCSSDEECSSTFCNSGTCAALFPDGSSCPSDTACTSGTCKAGKCAGDKCKSAQCESCDSNGNCAACTSLTLNSATHECSDGEPGMTCGHSSDCPSELCLGGRCCGGSPGTWGLSEGCLECERLDGRCGKCSAELGFALVNPRSTVSWQIPIHDHEVDTRGGGECQAVCNVEPEICYDYMLGDGTCDEECDTASCNEDNGDCKGPGLFDRWYGYPLIGGVILFLLCVIWFLVFKTECMGCIKRACQSCCEKCADARQTRHENRVRMRSPPPDLSDSASWWPKDNGNDGIESDGSENKPPTESVIVVNKAYDQTESPIVSEQVSSLAVLPDQTSAVPPVPPPNQTSALPPVPPSNQPDPAASPPQQTCQAIAAYTAAADDQLSLAHGETLTILYDLGAWWRLRNASGEEGLAPSNYVAKNTGAAALPPVPPSNQPDPAASPPQQTCQAIAAYTAAADDQLSLAHGETLTILDDTGAWWRLRNASGEEGMAPSNYVAKNTGAAALPPVTPSNQPDPAASPPQQTCQAIGAYTAAADDQLSLAQGETLTILDDTGAWWRLRNASGGEGMAPSNYVAKNAEAAVPPATGSSEA